MVRSTVYRLPQLLSSLVLASSFQSSITLKLPLKHLNLIKNPNGLGRIPVYHIPPHFPAGNPMKPPLSFFKSQEMLGLARVALWERSHARAYSLRAIEDGCIAVLSVWIHGYMGTWSMFGCISPLGIC